MNGKVRNVVYKKAIARIEKFMSNNAHHWKQDIDFMKHLLEEKQELEQILEKQKTELIELREERQFYKRNEIERAEELNELTEFARIVSKDIVISHNTTMSDDITYCCNFYNEILHKDKFNLIKKVVDKYGKR